jgi:hypothetical protein
MLMAGSLDFKLESVQSAANRIEMIVVPDIESTIELTTILATRQEENNEGEDRDVGPQNSVQDSWS